MKDLSHLLSHVKLSLNSMQQRSSFHGPTNNGHASGNEHEEPKILYSPPIQANISINIHPPSHNIKATTPIPQLDGPRDYHPPMIPVALRSQFPPQGRQPGIPPAPPGPPHNRAPVPKSAIKDLLPYCTPGVPLNEEQVVGLSDIAGSLKEVMLLALRARTDGWVKSDLAKAVGPEAAEGIIEFFGDELEM